MFKNFLMKSLLKSKLKGLPESQQDMLIGLIEKNPELFKKIGEKIEARIKNGMPQMQASLLVMKEHQSELQKLMKEVNDK